MLSLLTLIFALELAQSPAAPTGEPEVPQPILVVTQVTDADSSKTDCCPAPPWPPPTGG